MVFPLSQNSRYVYTPLTDFDGKETYTKWPGLAIFKSRPPEDLITRYQVPVQFSGRPDLIAADVYKDVNLFWVIVAFNNASEVFGWPKPLDIIEYPSKDIIFKE